MQPDVGLMVPNRIAISRISKGEGGKGVCALLLNIPGSALDFKKHKVVKILESGI